MGNIKRFKKVYSEKEVSYRDTATGFTATRVTVIKQYL
jgi:hypothetical protein